MNNDNLEEYVKSNLKILVNKSISPVKSVAAAIDFIKKIEKLNLNEVCLFITKLIFGEEIDYPQNVGNINKEYVFSIIDMDTLTFGLLKIYNYILKNVKLSNGEKRENKKIILEYIEEIKVLDPDNNNVNYEEILNLFI